MKKISAFFFLVIMLFVTACGDSPKLLEFLKVDMSEDLSGLELSWVWPEGSVTQAKYTKDTPQYDALISRISDIEKELKCTIKTDIFNKDSTGTAPDVEAELMAGTFDYDFVLKSADSQTVKSKLYYPMTDFSHIIDWTDSEKYGSKTLLEACMYAGVPYGVVPINWPGFEGVELFVAAYNRDLFKANGITDLQEYYENEMWTWETFENEFLAKITIDRTSDKKIYAFQTDQPDFYQCLIYSNNVIFVEEYGDGDLRAEPYPPSFIRAMEWGQRIITEYNDIILYDSDTYENEEYTSGEVFVVFAPTNTVTTGSIAYNKNEVFDSGIMPLPSGPNAVYGEWGQCVQQHYGFMIPVTTKIPEASARVISMLCEPLNGFEDKNMFYQMTFNNDLDVEIFLELGRYTRYDYTYVGTRELGRSIGSYFGTVVTNPSRSISEGMEQYRNVMLELIEEWIIPNYKTVYYN